MRLQIFPILLMLSLTLPTLAFGQNTEPVCGTELFHEKAAEENPAVRQAEKRANKLVKKRLAEAKNRPKKDAEDKMIIPVVVHVLHDNGPAKISEGAVREAIERLNVDFQLKNADTSTVRDMFKDRIADFEIEFRLVKKRPDGQCTNGITYTQTPLTNGQLSLRNMPQFQDQLPLWNPEEYLNIWTVREIASGASDAVIAGMANFPFRIIGFDGIMLRFDQVAFDDRTLTHEVGHYIGLYHPFQGGCTGIGDRVGDTPPATNRDGILRCNSNTNTCGGSTPDMLENYMDYSVCGAMFTEGQKARIQQFMKDPYRDELISDSNLAKTGVQVVDKPPKIETVTADKGQFYSCESINYSFRIKQSCGQSGLTFGNPTNIQWQFPGGTPSSSSGRNPKVKYDDPGTYEATLEISNQAGTDKVVKTRFVTLLGENAVLEPPFIEGFEDGELDNEGFISLQKQSGFEWKLSDTAAEFGNGSFFLNNFEAGNKNVSSFRLPRMDLSGLQSPELKFEMAFATIGQDSDDRLEIFFSTDCGKTWTKRKVIFSFLAKTSENETELFVPTADEWKTENVTLPSEPNVLVRFDWNSSEGGNNTYIDNIRMNWSVGKPDEPERSNAIAVYPNPTSGIVNIKNEGKTVNGTLRINSSAGHTIFENPSFNLPGGSQTAFEATQLNIEKPGVYYLTVNGSEQTISRKIVVLK